MGHPLSDWGACQLGLFSCPELEAFLKDGGKASQFVNPTSTKGSEVWSRGLKGGLLQAVLAAHTASETGDPWTQYRVDLARTLNWDAEKDMKCGHPYSLGMTPCHPLTADVDNPAFHKVRAKVWREDDTGADFQKLFAAARHLKLDLCDLDAIGWYTAPQAGWMDKKVPKLQDEPLAQRDVVASLNKALRALPSLKDLGVRLVTYRISSESSSGIGDLSLGTPVLFGTKLMPNRSYHIMSTSIMPNVKGLTQNVTKGSALWAIYGHSGRYIQWLGRHSAAMDGHEVLYLPGSAMLFRGEISTVKIPVTTVKRNILGQEVSRTTDEVLVPVYLFEEIPDSMLDFVFKDLKPVENLTFKPAHLSRNDFQALRDHHGVTS